MNKAKYVISIKKFESIKQAEETMTGHLLAGQFDQKTRLYKITKELRPTIKFKETKLI
jgi:hypothetical protein